MIGRYSAKSLTVFAVFLVCLITFTEAAGKQTTAVVLNDKNFDSKLANGDWLIEFYAPWCPHCKRLSKTWDETAAKVQNTRFHIGKVDCTSDDTKETRSRFDIKGYPTIYHVKGGQVREYTGKRSADDFVTFMKKGYTSVTPSKFRSAPSDDYVQLVYDILEYNIENTLEFCYVNTVTCSVIPLAMFFVGLVLGLLIAPSPEIPQNVPFVRTPRGLMKLTIKRPPVKGDKDSESEKPSSSDDAKPKAKKATNGKSKNKKKGDSPKQQQKQQKQPKQPQQEPQNGSTKLSKNAKKKLLKAEQSAQPNAENNSAKSTEEKSSNNNKKGKKAAQQQDGSGEGEDGFTEKLSKNQKKRLRAQQQQQQQQ